MNTIQETADKYAAVEALYNYIAGIDLRDKDLIISALAVDAKSDFRPAGKKAGFEYPVLEGGKFIADTLLASLHTIDTTHSVSNPRVSIEGEKATIEAMVEAQHLPSSDHSRHYMMKNRYDVELVRLGGAWLIEHIVVDNVWRIGDPTVLSGI